MTLKTTPDADDARATLADYLAARGFDAGLAKGPVGARYLALADGGGVPSPEAAFGRWFAGVLDAAGSMAAGEAESLGWIAFMIADAPARDLLAVLSHDEVAAIRALAPAPAFAAPLPMPTANLARARQDRRSGTRGVALEGRAA